jgi:hypothetical protein
MRSAIACIALTACFFKPDPPVIAPRDGAATGDTLGDGTFVIDALPAPGCQPGSFSDPFQAGPPCPWGTASETGGASITVGGGTLVMTPSGAMSSALCRTQSASLAFDVNGVFVEVVSAVQTVNNNGFTFMQALPATTSAVEACIGVENGKLRFGSESLAIVYHEVDYVPAAMRWWRLRRAGSSVAADFSPDGASWYQLGVHGGSVAANVFLYIDAGTSGSNPVAPGPARFRNLGICP